MYTQYYRLLVATALALAMVSVNAVSAATVSQDVIEARQETQIWTTYALSPYLRASDLKVAVHHGTAILTGTVDEAANKELAEQIALGVNGIKKVDNQIAVKADYEVPPRSFDRSYGEVVDDATITAAVKSKLLWSKHASGLATDVDTKWGKVTLNGTADSAVSRDLATRLALNTRGVASVDNKLVVHPKPSAADAAKRSAHEAGKDISDSWITTKVKSTYLYSTNVDGSDIAVSTLAGIVTLSGKVGSAAERALAIDLAENVRGVKGVRSKELML